MTRTLHAVAAGLALAFGVLSAGCSEEVNPFVDTDRYYSVYGYLDPAADTQFVRVVPLRLRVEEPEPGPLGVEVTVTDVRTGAVHTLRDSLVHFDDGTYGHVYYARFQPVHGRSYRLAVRRIEDGGTTTAETHVPAFTGAVVQGPGPGGPTTQTVVWEGIDFVPHRVEVWYRLSNTDPNLPFQDAPVVYTPDRLGRQEEGGWTVRVNLSYDRDRVAEALGYDPALALPFALYGVGMRLTHPDDQWRPPGGVWDPEVLSQPGVFSNVENGFGFFGSVGELTVEWTLSPELTRRIGFAYPD